MQISEGYSELENHLDFQGVGHYSVDKIDMKSEADGLEAAKVGVEWKKLKGGY